MLWSTKVLGGSDIVPLCSSFFLLNIHPPSRLSGERHSFRFVIFLRNKSWVLLAPAIRRRANIFGIPGWVLSIATDMASWVAAVSQAWVVGACR